MDQGYANLANAIVALAAADYRKALRELDRNPHNRSAKHTIREVEKFFHSSHFAILTKLDPEYLIKRLREEVADERKRVSKASLSS